jgi:Circadian oscillating protein COP23
MTTQRSRIISEMLVAILVLTGITGCKQPTTLSSDTPSQDPVATTTSSSNETGSELSTVFECVRQGSGWATTVRRGDDFAEAPLFTWDTPEFGLEWTPEKRCQEVTSRLSKAVESNAGRLHGLTLNTGKVDGYTVICILSTNQQRCSSNNMLVTLNKRNSQNPQNALAQILGFSEGQAMGNSILERNDLPGSFILEDVVNTKLINAKPINVENKGRF